MFVNVAAWIVTVLIVVAPPYLTWRYFPWRIRLVRR